MVEKGAYVVSAGGCISCHTDRKHGGKAFAGGRALATPFGTFYSPNITADAETGIGRWSDEDFVRALQRGEDTQGEHLYPVFPYTSYSKMTVEDMLAAKAYLFSLQPVHAPESNHVILFPLSWRPLMKAWKMLFFTGAAPMANDVSHDGAWNRGRYLVTALGHCAECHSPRGFAGAIDESAPLSGNRSGPDGWVVPALVGATKSNFTHWSVEEIAEYLKTGVKPDFDSAQGPMAEVIEDNTKFLTEDDRRAIAIYLKALKPS
jgi:mono/diheme cytochrome c family protein